MENIEKCGFVDIFNTDKKYNIIYADPPWQYGDKRTGKGKNNPNGAGGAEKHYKTMKTEDICNLPIKDIADDNCIIPTSFKPDISIGLFFSFSNLFKISINLAFFPSSPNNVFIFYFPS